MEDDDMMPDGWVYVAAIALVLLVIAVSGVVAVAAHLAYLCIPYGSLGFLAALCLRSAIAVELERSNQLGKFVLFIGVGTACAILAALGLWGKAETLPLLWASLLLGFIIADSRARILALRGRKGFRDAYDAAGLYDALWERRIYSAFSAILIMGCAIQAARLYHRPELALGAGLYVYLFCLTWAAIHTTAHAHSLGRALKRVRDRKTPPPQARASVGYLLPGTYT